MLSSLGVATLGLSKVWWFSLFIHARIISKSYFGLLGIFKTIINIQKLLNSTKVCLLLESNLASSLSMSYGHKNPYALM